MLEFIKQHKKSVLIILLISLIISVIAYTNWAVRKSYDTQMELLEMLETVPNEELQIAITKQGYPDETKDNLDYFNHEQRTQLFSLLATVEYDGVYKRSDSNFLRAYVLSESKRYKVTIVYWPENSPRESWDLWLSEDEQLNKLQGTPKDIAIKMSPELMEFLDSLFEKSGEV